MAIVEKCLKDIRHRLQITVEIKNIERVKGLPKSIFHLDWSLGSLEQSHYFKITTIQEETIYCHTSTLFNFFILKRRFFRCKNGKYSLMKIL